MKKPLRNTLLVVALVLGVQFGYAFHIQSKRAKMASQCANLSVEIGVTAANADEDGRPFDLEAFLSHFEGGALFPRDPSGHLLDSWGHPLAVEQTERDGAVMTRVTSAGRDGRFGTADDHFRENTFRRQATKQP